MDENRIMELRQNPKKKSTRYENLKLTNTILHVSQLVWNLIWKEPFFESDPSV